MRFAAAQPELFRLMVEEGKHSDARMRWLVDTRLKALYEGFEHVVAAYAPGLDRSLVPHAYYALAGAGSLMFAVAPECRRLTGLDSEDERTIEAQPRAQDRAYALAMASGTVVGRRRRCHRGRRASAR